MVEILGLAADIDHAVDRTRSAKHPAARIGDSASGGAGIGLGGIAPGNRRVVEQFHVAGRDMDQRVQIPPAGFEQYDAVAGIGAEPIGQYAPGRPRPDDHIVRLHAYPPPPPPDACGCGHGGRTACLSTGAIGVTRTLLFHLFYQDPDQAAATPFRKNSARPRRRGSLRIRRDRWRRMIADHCGTRPPGASLGKKRAKRIIPRQAARRARSLNVFCASRRFFPGRRSRAGERPSGDSNSPDRMSLLFFPRCPSRSPLSACAGQPHATSEHRVSRPLALARTARSTGRGGRGTDDIAPTRNASPTRVGRAGLRRIAFSMWAIAASG